MKKLLTLFLLLSLAIAHAGDNYIDRGTYEVGDPSVYPQFKTTETDGVHVPHVIVDSGGGGGGSGDGLTDEELRATPVPVSLSGVATAANQATANTSLSSIVPLAYVSAASFTRPADTSAYAALDVVSNSTSSPTVLTFAGVGPSAGHIMLTGVQVRWDDATIPAGATSFRLHLYDAAPTAINDNAAYNLPSGDRAKYLGYIDIPTSQDVGDTLWAQDFTLRQSVKLASASTSLFGILQTTSAYTPASGSVRTITLRAVKLAD